MEDQIFWSEWLAEVCSRGAERLEAGPDEKIQTPTGFAELG